MRVIDPLTGEPGSSASAARGGRRARELEREKQLVLKAIKEVELDYQMRKIAERDYREMVERYRTRAMRLMSEIEAGDDYRALIEKELAMRLKLEAAKPAPAAPQTSAPAAPVAALNLAGDTRKVLATMTPEEEKAVRKRFEMAEKVEQAARRSCAGCATFNDDDAQFCKKCGAKLASS